MAVAVTAANDDLKRREAGGMTMKLQSVWALTVLSLDFMGNYTAPSPMGNLSPPPMGKHTVPSPYRGPPGGGSGR